MPISRLLVMPLDQSSLPPRSLLNVSSQGNSMQGQHLFFSVLTKSKHHTLDSKKLAFFLSVGSDSSSVRLLSAVELDPRKKDKILLSSMYVHVCLSCTLHMPLFALGTQRGYPAHPGKGKAARSAERSWGEHC